MRRALRLAGSAGGASIGGVVYRRAASAVNRTPLARVLSSASQAVHVYPAGGDARPDFKDISHFERSRRTGLVAMKVGMLPEFDEWGVRHPLTVLSIEDCQVTQAKSWEEPLPSGETRQRFSLQVGAGQPKMKRLSKALKQHFRAGHAAAQAVYGGEATLPAKRYMAEFSVTGDAVLPVGTRLTAQHFVPGQLVDVIGTSKGKGFQGGMKRHGFKGQSASHGVSKTHRSIGSTGGCQDPGRVFKGKKMPGQMGNKQRTTSSVEVYRVDPEKNLLFIKGTVPGPSGGYVRVRDTRKWWKREKNRSTERVPFPTFFAEDGEGEDAIPLNRKNPEQDPLDYSL